MRVLVVKLTSMGDALHLLPALTDLQSHHADVTVDWMIEDSFSEIPRWHAAVDRVIPVATRRWRKFNLASVREFLSFWRVLRGQHYDVVIDAQGLMKSAVFARFAKLAKGGVRAGFSGDSIKESPAAKLYQKRIAVKREQHAIDRLRALFAGVFGYTVKSAHLDYQLELGSPPAAPRQSVMLLHGTTWSTKHLPDAVWRELADLAADDGYQVQLAWGNEVERQRAEWIAKGKSNVTVLEKSNLTELAQVLRTASGAIAVDTGLGHLAAALGVPCVSAYGATDANLTGTRGQHQVQLQSSYPCSPCLLKTCPKLTAQVLTPPCYQQLDADRLWQALYQQIV
ncbi:lipopolysaccharide heptosyltransferase I [Arenicella xantha]|uniref:Lipopolysaccharide heptosyltransferase 1 n=1 Tax=Arenicella xantha TaxID=644221 RepID=A0A395JGL7_9GAMM|nr:lipopolysaccharide heptosyltransferase I [Arenicella xantha]RBP48881.1 heptosyltransferase-1 [Arenicella xantha]